MKCRFCGEPIDDVFGVTKVFKGITYFLCARDPDCSTLNHFDGHFFVFHGRTAINRHKGRKCLLDIQFETDPEYFLVDFLDGTKEIVHIDNLSHEIENDL